MSRIHSYQDALHWLYNRNQFSIKLGLEGPKKLLQALGQPQLEWPCLHIAGTNGKGSVCANLAAMLSAIGIQRVGLYTSPHLVSFRERMRIDGNIVSPKWVTQWLQKSKPLLEELQSTYFECATAMAFCWFRENDCNAVVLETGLGGRLDATTVAMPKVTIITSISKDHMQFLGNTLPEIWQEKLGIVKPGVPLIIDEENLELASIAELTAKNKGAPFYNMAGNLKVTEEGFVLQTRFATIDFPKNLRVESHQIRNAALSMVALESFLENPLPTKEKWLPALSNARMPGRTQWLESDGFIPILMDGAHNPGGIQALCQHLATLKKGNPRFLFAVMRDKEAAILFESLHLMSPDIVYMNLGKSFPRALTTLELCTLLPSNKRAGLKEAEITWEAMEPLLRKENGANYAVVCGSLYLLGEVIPLLLNHYRGLEEFRKILEEEREGFTFNDYV